jgi:hypothetical protein
MPQPHGTSWHALEAKADLPEVQAVLCQAIRDGTIRVAPRPDGGIRILPISPGVRPPAIPAGPRMGSKEGRPGFPAWEGGQSDLD